MAGSVMPHIPESRIYFELLKKRCKQFRLDDMIEVRYKNTRLFYYKRQTIKYYASWINAENNLNTSPYHPLVQFIPDPSDERKFQLYRQCDSVIYTPPNEHFGIVPIEALEQRRPVIVIDSGGPSETVIEGVTGTKVSRRFT
jgi:glycosyltransferase involved in cell wall biosynthesis